MTVSAATGDALTIDRISGKQGSGKGSVVHCRLVSGDATKEETGG